MAGIPQLRYPTTSTVVSSDGREVPMCGATARTVMMALMLAGIALALSAQGVVARHASAPVTIIVSPDRAVNADKLPVKRVFKAQGGHRFAGHRVHRSGSRTFHPVQRQIGRASCRERVCQYV